MAERADADPAVTASAPRFEPARPVRAYERVVQQVEEAIFRGDLRPGQRLPSERDLMQQFAVSRSTVREALRVLQSAGLVRSRPGDPNGPEVLPFSTEAMHKSMRALARIEHLRTGELLQFRMFVEGAASRLAARLRTAEQLASMDAAMAGMERAVTADYETFSRADLAFHDRLADAAGNKLLRVCNEVVRGVLLSLIAENLAHSPDSTDTMRDSIRRHRLVLDAVRAGDGRRAAVLARRHIYEYYASYVDPAERAALEALLDDDD